MKDKVENIRDLEVIDFVKMFDAYTAITFIWYWRENNHLVKDEEYSFQGSRDDFIEKYTKHYDCINGFTLEDLAIIRIENIGFLQVRRALTMCVHRY